MIDLNEKKPFSVEHISKLIEAMNMLEAEKVDVKQLLQENSDRYLELHNLLQPSPELYEWPMASLATKLIALAGNSQELKTAASSCDPSAELLDYIINLQDLPSDGSQLDDIDKSLILHLMHILESNVECLRRYGKTIATLLSEIPEDTQSLYNAVSIDPYIASAPSVVRRLREADIRGQSEVRKKFDRALASATKERKRPKPHYDILRLVAVCLGDSGQLVKLSDDELNELFIHEFELYPSDGEDPVAGLKKLLKTVADLSRT